MYSKKLFAAAILALTVSTVIPSAAQSALTRANRPRLVVNIIVGQMRYDYLTRFADNFSEKGFHTLVQGGALCTRATYDYSLTNTAAGLATISSGANPSVHGVVGDSWFNYTTMQGVNAVTDTRVYAVGGNDYDGQYSPRQLIAPTLGDALKSASRSSDSKVVSIGFEARSAILTGGYTANAAYWVNPRDGHIATSTYYMPALPQWVQKFNADGIATNYSSEKWSVSKPIKAYHNELYSDISLDGDQLSFDFVTRKKYDYARLSASPGGNTLLKDLAVQAVIYEGLGKDDAPDLLNIVFDASRLIGERYGTASVELEDSYYRLDTDLGSLLEFLETQVGKQHLLVVLTSDHGASDPVNQTEPAVGVRGAGNGQTPVGVFNPTHFSAIISGFLGAQLGPQEWLLKYDNRQIYLNRKLIYERGHNLEDIQSRVANFAIQFSGVAQAVTGTALQGGRYSGGVLGRMQNSYFPRNSGDVMICLMPGWIELADQKISDGGSPYNYDVHVPVIFYGGAVGNRDVTREVNMTDIAPTVADILGISAPAATTGSPITELYHTF